MTEQDKHDVKITEFDVFFKNKETPAVTEDDSVNEIFEDGKEGLGGLVGHAIGALSQMQQDDDELVDSLND